MLLVELILVLILSMIKFHLLSCVILLGFSFQDNNYEIVKLKKKVQGIILLTLILLVLHKQKEFVMKNFNFGIPQNIEAGMGSLNKLPEMLGKLNSNHVFLVSDRGLESLGVVGKVAAIIEAGNIKCSKYLDVVSNPTVDVVNDATSKFKESGATSIVVLGGGSPMDVAKAVGVLAVHGGVITDYEGPDKVPGPIVPTIAIPTTAGTGSEVTASAVISDEVRNYKLSVLSFEMIPKQVILDPSLIMTAPAGVAAACGIDAFIHAMEAFLSLNATPFTDAFGEKAMYLIGKYLRRFVANRKDEEAACAMMVGSTFAGVAFAWARLGNIHALSHPVSAFYHVPHGVANAILMPAVIEFNALADKEGKYEKIYNFLSEDDAPVKDFKPQMLTALVREINEQIGIPSGLAQVGVKEEGIEAMAADAMKAGNILVNPRQTNVKDCIALYKASM